MPKRQFIVFTIITVISVAGDPTKTALVLGFNIGITASFFSAFEEPIDVMVVSLVQ